MASITVKEGKRYPIKLTYKDSNGFAIPLTGATARMVVKKSYFKPAIIDIAATIDEPNGIMVFEITAASTAGLLSDKTEEAYLFDIDLTELGKEPRGISSGTFTIQKSTIS